MQELIRKLYDQGLSRVQVENLFMTIQEWLDAHYPILSQIHRTEFLNDILEANKKTNPIPLKKKKAA